MASGSTDRRCAGGQARSFQKLVRLHPWTPTPVVAASRTRGCKNAASTKLAVPPLNNSAATARGFRRCAPYCMEAPRCSAPLEHHGIGRARLPGVSSKQANGDEVLSVALAARFGSQASDALSLATDGALQQTALFINLRRDRSF